MKILQKAILPAGFLASGVYADLKKRGPDLALFYSPSPAKAACLFTANKLIAAPLVVCKDNLKNSKVFNAIIANSGNANCFTGTTGLNDAQKTASIAAELLGVKKDNVFVASTGIIGKRLPVDKIKKAIPALVRCASEEGINEAKKAILTTDTFAKEATVKFKVGSHRVSICGVAKGAGMIAPNMATMLVFIFTDANISQALLNKALRSATDSSFNCITVDGCMSTNDSVIMLANSQAGNKIIRSGKYAQLFTRALQCLCLDLAKKIVKDAEGATKFITIKVSGARNPAQARLAGLSVANSSLFKTAVYGQNPNFGRIVAAIGACGVAIKEKKFKMKISPLDKRNIDVEVFLGLGKSSVTVYTSDLTPEYIKINAEYN